MRKSLKYWSAVAGIVLSSLAGTGNAQVPVHTIVATYETLPSGPNSEFTIDLEMDPADIDISGFSIAIGYDNTQVSFLTMEDNTGQPSAFVEYLVGQEQELQGVSYANVYRPVIMSTAFDLMTPQNLGRARFRTTANYSRPDNLVFVYLTGRDRNQGAGDQYGGLTDGDFKDIPTAYDSLTPSDSSVTDWSTY
jgi:hypothetical protein